ncbi:MAG: type VI secretion system contractile sheath small subunit [Desulfarculales bacterium]|jgi:type VI secretion system protein ImpB|nr:type VI secretion system contractile sheath small subunit [Desulfarculales bacterium]
MAARESSIAPKERINVTFKPATGGAMEEIELPLKIAVVGDFLFRHDERNILERKPVSINKNNFDDVLAKQNLNLKISVPNHLLDKKDGTFAESILVDLEIKNLRDFTPEGVARQVPELQKLLDLREALVSLKGPLGNVPAFRKTIEEILKNPAQRDQVLKELVAANNEIGTDTGNKSDSEASNDENNHDNDHDKN